MKAIARRVRAFWDWEESTVPGRIFMWAAGVAAFGGAWLAFYLVVVR